MPEKTIEAVEAVEEIVEVPVTETAVEEESTVDGAFLDLQDVAYMVVAGRKKDGETFFRSVNINDLVVIRGLVEYARDEVKHEFAKYFEGKGN